VDQDGFGAGRFMKFNSDIDIDLADRQHLLDVLGVVPASQLRDGKLVKHNTGVYATQIPVDPFSGCASLDYLTAEQRGYIKLDLLNVHVYRQVKNEEHLIELMREPDWARLYDPAICQQLVHINNHYETLLKMPEPVDSIPRLAMFLAVIRPAKRHLIGRPWSEVAKTIWDKPMDGGYYFKRSHSVSYAQLVVVNLNLLCEPV
jgi:hypothetical protein